MQSGMFEEILLSERRASGGKEKEEVRSRKEEEGKKKSEGKEGEAGGKG